MNHAIHKIAGSTLIAALTLTGSTGPSPALARGGFEVHRAEGDAARQAGALRDQAARALQQGQVGTALTAMEQAVALSPRDAGFRLLLADLYLKSGRLDSARATYADVTITERIRALHAGPDRPRVRRWIERPTNALNAVAKKQGSEQ